MKTMKLLLTVIIALTMCATTTAQEKPKLNGNDKVKVQKPKMGKRVDDSAQKVRSKVDKADKGRSTEMKKAGQDMKDMKDMTPEEKKAHLEKLKKEADARRGKTADEKENGGKTDAHDHGTHTHADGTVHRNDAHDKPKGSTDPKSTEAVLKNPKAKEKADKSMGRLNNASRSQQNAAAKVKRIEAALKTKLANKEIDRATYDANMKRLEEMKEKMSELRKRQSVEKRKLKGLSTD